jgi:hypothetical protein
LSQSKKIKLLGLGIKAGLTVSILRNRGGDIVLAIGDFFKPCPSRAKAGFKELLSG